MRTTFVAQEGGTHYQAGYQHWDWVTDIGLHYLPATATKYLTRWRKKNGLQDLQKAMSYISKTIVSWDTVFEFSVSPPENLELLNARFFKENELDPLGHEALICVLLSDLSRSDAIDRVQEALRLLQELIQLVTPDAK